MAMAEKQDRTILVRLGSPHLFSDIDGRHVIKLDGSSTSRHETCTTIGNSRLSSYEVGSGLA